MEKNRVKVLISGTEYTLVSSEPAEYVQRVAVMADRKLNEIYESSPRLSTAMASMLAAINLADDYIKLDDSADNLRKQIADLSKSEEKLSAELAEYKERSARLEEEVQNLKIELARRSGASGYNKR